VKRALGCVDMPSIMILCRQGWPLAIWLRAPSKTVHINENTPILHSSQMILIKSRKLYNTGRLLHGHGHDFVCMGRMRAIRYVMFEAASFPAQFVQMLHISQEHVMSSRSLYHQAISNAPYIEEGEKTKGSLESNYIQSQSLPTLPIEGQDSTSTSRNFVRINHNQRIIVAFPR